MLNNKKMSKKLNKWRLVLFVQRYLQTNERINETKRNALVFIAEDEKGLHVQVWRFLIRSSNHHDVVRDLLHFHFISFCFEQNHLFNHYLKISLSLQTQTTQRNTTRISALHHTPFKCDPDLTKPIKIIDHPFQNFTWNSLADVFEHSMDSHRTWKRRMHRQSFGCDRLFQSKHIPSTYPIPDETDECFKIKEQREDAKQSPIHKQPIKQTHYLFDSIEFEDSKVARINGDRTINR
jgi:hypothetical protein